MNTEKIGQAAGLIWNQLNVNGLMTFNELKYNTHLTDIVLYSAIGWLAREGKLMIDGEECALV